MTGPTALDALQYALRKIYESKNLSFADAVGQAFTWFNLAYKSDPIPPELSWFYYACLEIVEQPDYFNLHEEEPYRPIE